ncbi:alpha-galactosidase [Friedmanniella endophytica]|uniref:Alpha-galactosidase n=1 Tax=Microlunatus kandeliicorticis TaxID=1759536 RepID=A0A7W3IU88_9ACTN|nr:alpha-galactosidase [Microlunatus kandeliicorticis]MBA8795377.1 alpha-galactosidase [Microlunatus kandeliicorticis]
MPATGPSADLTAPETTLDRTTGRSPAEPTVRPPSAEIELSRTRSGPGAATWTPVVTAAAPGTAVRPDLAVVQLPGLVRLVGFASSWGMEFQPLPVPTGTAAVVETTAGRSSNQAMPWLFAELADGWYAITVHWSGNWRFSLDGQRLHVGLRPEGQTTTVGDGPLPTLPAVSVGWGADRPAAAAALVRHLAASGPTAPLLTEWNHWWPYEDAEITEDVFLANAAVAADLGLEVAVLDAGWFGRSDAGSDWVGQRGDWDLVNTARFPHGLAWLADRTREHGIDFGIWIEAEAVGPEATVAARRPELLARGAAGEPLGYVCLGSPAGQEHVRRSVSGLIEATGARWIKWDFNLDPGDGCARDDHGHGPGDGLLSHYRGLYAVLDALRSAHPGTLFEACSSGGLRIDAGLAEHVHAFFLSDPDWTEHALTCLWGAAQQLPPRQLLHWPQSEWRGEHRFQKVDYSGTLLTVDRFDTMIRAAMLHRFGISVRLTEMRADLRARLRHHLGVYDRHLRPLLADGVLVPLGEQPLHAEQGWRQPAFQLTSGRQHVVAGFRLPPTGSWLPLHPRGLDPDARYEVRDLGDESVTVRTGRELSAEGLTAADTATSVLWSLSPCS